MKEVELNELEPEKQPMNAASGAAMAMVMRRRHREEWSG